MFLLDTNVISEMRKSKPHGAVAAWYRSQPPQAYFLPAVALLELQAGAEITRRQDQSKAQQIERWIEVLVNSASILDLDVQAAREAARMMHGRSSDLFENAMIAAIAKVHGLTVATRNVRHFKLLKVPIIDPFRFAVT